MDTIVEITRRGGVTTLRLQSGDTVRLPSAVYVERRLAVGQAVNAEAYRAFVRERSYPHALETAVKYLALRERSENEVRARLRAACYDDGVIQRVMDTLAGHSLVSDSRFAGQWAYSRARKYGKGRIARELRSKGVSQADTQRALEDIPEEEEYRRALLQAVRLARKFQNDPRKMQQALIRRGYHWALARRAAEEALADAASSP